MKRLIFNILVIAFILIITQFQGCKKDDADKKNYLNYNGKDYDLSEGFIEYYGQIGTVENSFNFDVTLFSSGLIYNSDLDYFTGKGNIVTIQLFSPSSTDITEGEYVYDPVGNGAQLTFYDSQFAFNFDTNAGTGIEGGVTGKVIVKNSKGSYEFTFDCIASDGKKITGYYKGILQKYDYSNNQKKKSSVKY